MNTTSLPVGSLLLAALGLAQAGCSSDRSICGEEEVCPAITAESSTEDAEIRWDSAITLSARLRGESASPRVIGGGAVFTPLDPACGSDCDYTLKSLHFELEAMSFVMDGGLDIRELRLGIDPEKSLPLTDTAGETTVPQGTRTIACAKINGEPLATGSELGKSAKLVIDPERELFRFEGELVFEFRAVPNRECTDYRLTLSGAADASTPWTQDPGIDQR